VSDAGANERRRDEVAGAESGARSDQSGTVSDAGANERRRDEVAGAESGARSEQSGTVSDAGANGRRRDEVAGAEMPPGTRTGRRAPTVVLASASTGRLSVLRGAGLDPVVLVSGVDEEALMARHADAEPEDLVAALAGAKAEAVVRDHGSGGAHDPASLADAVVIGGDSMLLLDERLQGKPRTRDEALRRWDAQAGRTGTLLSGLAVLRVRAARVVGSAVGTAATTVRFGTPSIEEITAYIDSGEPLGVAGAFTIDGLGGWFVDGIAGDPSCVVGLSLPLLRRLLTDVDVTVTDLWRSP